MKLTLIKKKEEATGTKSFFWKPETEVKYSPGQYFYYTLPKLNYPDARGATRHFTISSSPTEGDILRLTTRIRQESGYKKTLDELSIGSVIEGQGPEGTFVFDGNETGIQIFAAGGIGITPFRSFIKYALDKKLSIPLYLIYSNSDSEFIFKNDLDDWQQKYTDLKIIYFDSSKSGHLDKLKINEIIKEWKLPARNAFSIANAGGEIGKLSWWVVGPPAFTNAMEDEIDKLGVTAESVHSEKFSGY